jgi:hypothetical protein
MPHNYQDYEVVQVAFPRNSPVLARLKEEAKRYTGRANAGPHIFELLVDRDAHLYGSAEGEGRGIWFPPSYQPQVIATVPPEEQLHVEPPPTVIEESDTDLIDKQAASMAAAFADDDDE